MDHKVIGTTMPVLEMQLEAGESIVAEGGELSWMTGPIQLETAASGKAGAKGMFGAVKRAVAGGSLFMTEYTAQGGPGMVAFATKVPGQILPIEVSADQSYMVHRGGYLCGLPGVSLEIGFQQKFSAGLFGGAGFILQKVSGDGPAWIELDGEVVDYDLAPGQEIMVHPGHVGMFEAGMSFELERIKGIKNVLFGADALFLAKLTGPGKVWLQTLPLPNLAAALAPYIATDSGATGARAATSRSATSTSGTDDRPCRGRATSRRLPAVILSDVTIREELAAGRIIIDPLSDDAVQPSSVDLHVDRYFRVFRNDTTPYIDPKQHQEDLTELVEVTDEGAFILHPGEFVLGSTLERVALPDDLVARLEGKSSLGRLGLLIHSSLPASETIMVLDDGVLQPRPIGDVVRKQQQGYVVGFDPETFEVGYHEITGWYEGPADRIFEITLRSGRRVRVTAGHNLFTLDRDGRIRKVRTAELGAGVRVAVPRRIPDPDFSRTTIDLFDVIPESAYPELVCEGPAVRTRSPTGARRSLAAPRPRLPTRRVLRPVGACRCTSPPSSTGSSRPWARRPHPHEEAGAPACRRRSSSIASSLGSSASTRPRATDGACSSSCRTPTRRSSIGWRPCCTVSDCPRTRAREHDHVHVDLRVERARVDRSRRQGHREAHPARGLRLADRVARVVPRGPGRRRRERRADAHLGVDHL